MLTRELEGEDIVIEILPQAVHTIVTVETGRAEGQSMGGHEDRVQLTVARITGFWSKGCDIAVVAIITGERLTRGRKLVSV
jgi:hypothetical protein